ncbi:hypothetical protein ERC79_10510 [Rhodococcus sp. ABRD24]|uniref:YqeB family protein n=1 Tax=Rhodococcus sp. ABRD24 TaxID=2507582 RepID=UPI00103FB8AF|nr:hypothetical protein [Rhodococcus sp. ABRD24]QBJ96349.1 hypothetical protein ERC79_10510 [Rhodococcus sp. ABRD24]
MSATLDKTTVRHSTVLHIALWTMLPIFGALVGLVLSRVPSWLAALAWFPNQDKITELADVIGFKVALVVAIVGLLAGCLLAVMAYDHIVSVTVDDQNVTIRRSDEVTILSAAEVNCVFVDEGHLVLLGSVSEELARERTGLSLDALEVAFTSHGYSWRGRDPHADSFTRWIDGASGLSQDANAILRARQDAMDSGDSEDQRELRSELARHRIVVRDSGKRQYWRPLNCN